MNSPKMILEPYPSQTNCFRQCGDHSCLLVLFSKSESERPIESKPFLTIQSLPSVVTPCTPCNDAVLLGGPGKWPGNLENSDHPSIL